jgi:D-cysteine desulfhydrase/L-cysteate sulfo-lyase
MSALIDHVRSGKLDPHDTVVFLHTGGNPALFAHGEHLL